MMSHSKKIIIALLVSLAVCLAVIFQLYRQLNSSTSATTVSQDEVSQLVLAVGKLIVLPKDETPTVATVTNPEKLVDQPFFANAKKGDKVLIFSASKKAILYNPTDNKIVEVGPINVDNI